MAYYHALQAPLRTTLLPRTKMSSSLTSLSPSPSLSESADVPCIPFAHPYIFLHRLKRWGDSRSDIHASFLTFSQVARVLVSPCFYLVAWCCDMVLKYHAAIYLFRFLCSCSGAFVDSYFVVQEALEEFLEDGLCNLICEENVTGWLLVVNFT